jgi:putative DNA primase/helicase
MAPPDAAKPPEGGPDTIPVQEIKDQDTSTDVDAPDPFAVAAPVYKAKGWPPIPITDDGKGTTPGGVTGYDGVDLEGAKLRRWIKKYGHCVIAVRMPEGVDPDGREWKMLGLDVDAYDDKPGGETLAKWGEEWGELPPTYISSSRDDGVSGIRFYKVPRDWFGIGGAPGLELIQRHHRQAVVAPSLHEKRKVPYRWRAEDGLPEVEIPEAGAMPWLPQRWLDGLNGPAVPAVRRRWIWGRPRAG